MQLIDDVYDKDYYIITGEYDRYTTFAQTQLEYNGCLSQDDDALDHIRFPRLAISSIL